MHIHQETERWAGPDLAIDCPACHERSVPATTFDQQTREKLYGLIPLNNVRSSWVVCSSCKVPMRSRVDTAELEGKTPVELADLLYLDASFLQKAMAIIALLIAIFPIVGTLFAAVALFANRKYPSWPRTVSWVALGLSFLPLALFAVAMFLTAIGVNK